MTRQFLAVSHIHGLALAGNCGAGLEVFPGCHITNEPKSILSLISPGFKSALGEITISELTRSKAVISLLLDVPPELHGKARIAGLHQYIIGNLRAEFNLFLQFLWMLKDHGAALAQIHSIYPLDQPDAMIVFDRFPIAYSNSSGADTPITCTIEEFRKALTLASAYLDYPNPFKRRPSPASTEPAPVTKLHREAPRIWKAFLFLQSARRQDDLAMKVSHYCSTLETLFSTSQNEITHKLAERVAFLAGDSPAERLSIYRSIKEAYKVRSEVLHGSFLTSNRICNLVDIARRCDALVRTVMFEILEKPTLKKVFQNDATLDSYFEDMIFGL